MKICRICKLEKPLEDFHKARTTKDRLMTRCRMCDHSAKQEYKTANYERIRIVERNSYLIRTYGITLKEYQETNAVQNSTCAICSKPETAVYLGKLRSLSVDHNHTTGKVRGLLCQKCNTALGMLDENKNSIDNLISYLKRYDI